MTPEEEAQAIREWAKREYGLLPVPKYVIAARYAVQLEAALKAREGTWQPIETAPKDGIPVLVGYSGVVWIDCWNDGYWEEGHPYAPTHWMPLPSPPAAAQQKGSE